MATRIVGLVQQANLKTSNLMLSHVVQAGLNKTKKRQLANPNLLQDVVTVVKMLQSALVSTDSSTYGFTARQILERVKIIKIPKIVANILKVTKRGRVNKFDGSFIGYQLSNTDAAAMFTAANVTAFDLALQAVYDAFMNADLEQALVSYNGEEVSFSRDTHCTVPGLAPEYTISRVRDDSNVTANIPRANTTVISSFGLPNIPPITGGTPVTSVTERVSSENTTYTANISNTPAQMEYHDRCSADPLDRIPGPDLVSEAVAPFVMTAVNDANILFGSTHSHIVTAAEAPYFATMILDKLDQMCSPKPKVDDTNPNGKVTQKRKGKGPQSSTKVQQSNPQNPNVNKPLPPGILDGQTQTNSFVSDTIQQLRYLVDKVASIQKEVNNTMQLAYG